MRYGLDVNRAGQSGQAGRGLMITDIIYKMVNEVGINGAKPTEIHLSEAVKKCLDLECKERVFGGVSGIGWNLNVGKVMGLKVITEPVDKCIWVK